MCLDDNSMCIACDYDSGSVLVGRAEVRGSALQCCVQFARCFLMAKSIAPWLMREQPSENRAANPITIQAFQCPWLLIACAMRVCTHDQVFCYILSRGHASLAKVDYASPRSRHRVPPLNPTSAWPAVNHGIIQAAAHPPTNALVSVALEYIGKHANDVVSCQLPNHTFGDRSDSDAICSGCQAGYFEHQNVSRHSPVSSR